MIFIQMWQINQFKIGSGIEGYTYSFFNKLINLLTYFLIVLVYIAYTYYYRKKMHEYIQNITLIFYITLESLECVSIFES